MDTYSLDTSSSFVYHRHMSSSVSQSHAIVSGPTRKRPSSEGGLYKGQVVMMCSAVCSGSPHSHPALSARPHLFMDALNRPTPVRRRFSSVHCRRGRSSPWTPSPGSRMWMCIRDGSADSHSRLQAVVIQVPTDMSSGMVPSISRAVLPNGRRDLSLLGGTARVVISCRMCH